ncbi:hypothetical protein ACP26L_12815 [Paenibacillus sp. S-38]
MSMASSFDSDLREAGGMPISFLGLAILLELIAIRVRIRWKTRM